MLIWIYISWDLMCLNDCHPPAPPLSWISGDHLKKMDQSHRGGGGCKVARQTPNQMELHLHIRGIDGGDEQLCLFHLARIRGYPPPSSSSYLIGCKSVICLRYMLFKKCLQIHSEAGVWHEMQMSRSANLDGKGICLEVAAVPSSLF